MITTSALHSKDIVAEGGDDSRTKGLTVDNNPGSLIELKKFSWKRSSRGGYLSERGCRSGVKDATFPWFSRSKPRRENSNRVLKTVQLKRK